MSFLSYNTLGKLFNCSEPKMYMKIKDIEHGTVPDMQLSIKYVLLLGIAIIIIHIIMTCLVVK